MEYLFLGLALFTPTLLIISWLYWTFPRNLPRTLARRRFDAAVLLLSVVFAFALGYVGVAHGHNAAHAALGGWQMAAPPLYSYAGYSMVMALGLFVRHRIWRQRDRS